MFGLALLSATSIAIDTSSRLFEPVRSQLATMISPVYMLAESPYMLMRSSGDFWRSHEQLRADNQFLKRRMLELSEMSQQFISLRAENDRLRALLGSRGRQPYEVLIAELVGLVPDPATFQVVIDKGARQGVRMGQAVLDADGLYGQIVEVGQYSSRVLLISDASHAVPVQVSRNGVRAIAGGTGSLSTLLLENGPVSTDIAEGDLVETSGLGGRFPPGYPVGRVESVVIEATSQFAEVQVAPSAALDRSRHVLIVFRPEHLDDESSDETAAGASASDPAGVTP